MPTASPYETIGELVEVDSAGSVTKPEQANTLLKEGYILVKVIEKTNTDRSTTIVYVLGRPREWQQQSRQSTTAPNKPVGAPPAKLQTSGGTSAEQKALESLKWTKFKDGKGEWAFYLGPTGEPLPNLKPAEATINKMKSDEKFKATMGAHVYNIKGKFLNRFPVPK